MLRQEHLSFFAYSHEAHRHLFPVHALCNTGSVYVTCNIEDNSDADVVNAIDAVKTNDEMPVPNELVQLENRGGEFFMGGGGLC